jgi:hypothetical protein
MHVLKLKAEYVGIGGEGKSGRHADCCHIAIAVAVLSWLCSA